MRVYVNAEEQACTEVEKGGTLHLEARKADRLSFSFKFAGLRDTGERVRSSADGYSGESNHENFDGDHRHFLPLSFIAGRYDMNVNMPEFQNEDSYSAAIVLSMIIVICCIRCFKKSKWF